MLTPFTFEQQFQFVLSIKMTTSLCDLDSTVSVAENRVLFHCGDYYYMMHIYYICVFVSVFVYVCIY